MFSKILEALIALSKGLTSFFDYLKNKDLAKDIKEKVIIKENERIIEANKKTKEIKEKRLKDINSIDDKMLKSKEQNIKINKKPRIIEG